MSKALNLSRTTFVLSLILAFFTGIGLDQLIQHYYASKSPVPGGDWKSIWVSNEGSLQINLSSIALRNSAVTTWIREDKANHASPMYGLTILTRATIDCESRFVSIHEQRVLDPGMNVVFSNITNDGPSEPKTFSTIMSLNLICGMRPAKNSPSQKQDYMNMI